VFVETSKEGFISNVSSMLNGFNGITLEGEGDKQKEVEREIVMVTTDRNRAFQGKNVSNFHLSNLNFHYPSYNLDYDSEDQNAFVKRYERLYRGLPSKYATRGFDLTLDILLRLASADNLYNAVDNTMETQYVENKFRYSKKLFGGYFNEAAFIVKYDDLKIIEVKQ